MSRFRIFYNIYALTTSVIVIGNNEQDAKRRFKEIYGGWIIQNIIKVS